MKTYKIEIQSKLTGNKTVFFIGRGLELVSDIREASPCTEADSLAVMERIDCVAVCSVVSATCDECGEVKDASELCDPTASEPHCKECAEGFWEMMGDDPCGKDWR